MKERPIIFSGPMVCAILDGRKTMTRRILKPQPDTSKIGQPFHPESRGGRAWVFMARDDRPGYSYATADSRVPYAVGDRLWVRETWAVDAPLDEVKRGMADAMGPALSCGPYYRATECAPETLRWRPSIHMPRWASRITLEVTGVKVERLQEISWADARAEGVEFRDNCWGTWDADGSMRCGGSHDPREAFRCLWINIHGTGAWDQNPWVVAVSFVCPAWR